MAASDVVARNDFKHPYLIALIRWLASSFWTTASLVLHRIITVPISPVAGTTRTPKPRPASFDHLHPEPTVECVVLHAPEHPTLDVIFVHGLYGSLGNTWRQGEWKPKYRNDIVKVPLRRPYTGRDDQTTNDNDKKIGEYNEVKLGVNKRYSSNKINGENEINQIKIISNDIGVKRNNYKTDIGKGNEKQNNNNDCEDDLKNDKNFNSLQNNSKLHEDLIYFDKLERKENDLKKREKFSRHIQNCDNQEISINIHKLENERQELNSKFKIWSGLPEINKCYEKESAKTNQYQKNIRKKSLNDIDNLDFKIKRLSVENIDLDSKNVNPRRNLRKKSLNDIELNNVEFDGQFYRELRKFLPQDMYITEKFYNNTLLDHVEIVGNYETQAQFVKDLFESENREVKCKCKVKDGDCNCDFKCDIGCGCLCDDCYSPCWPRDWVPADYPGARILSVNYTSDPYLWRPLWIKESKRMTLNERAEQMFQQLLDLGVGEKPIIWVGHSKGGLFIKKLYCKGYEAYLKTNFSDKTPEEFDNMKNELTLKDMQIEKSENNAAFKIDSEVNNSKICDKYCDTINKETYKNDNFVESNIISHKRNDKNEEDIDENKNNNDKFELTNLKDNIEKDKNDNNIDIQNKHNKNIQTSDVYEMNNDKNKMINIGDQTLDDKSKAKNNTQMDILPEGSSNSYEELIRRSRIWSNSAGFMFYSVPHRGSPLADIKTPITARSIELMEICKECDLVLSLQEQWSKATLRSRPAVRSVVETCKTLMSVLWLRIVSVDSADPGIGTLWGVSVDHREICKPSSRKCLLYQELMTLMKTALRNKDV